MNQIESELRYGSDLETSDWLTWDDEFGGMSWGTYDHVQECAEAHGFYVLDFPDDAISYAVEAAEALGL